MTEQAKLKSIRADPLEEFIAQSTHKHAIRSLELAQMDYIV